MPDGIPFSIGLEALPADALRQPTAMGGGGVGGMGMMGGASFMGGTIGLGAVQTDGDFITDQSLKQAYIPMTVFQSFPVKLPDGTYTMVSDHTGKGDDAGTNLGGLAVSLNRGIAGCPDNFNKSILNGMKDKVPNFKVGASCSTKFGTQYLKYFYPDVQWGVNDFGTLKNRLLLCAEVVCPISSTEGKPIRIKMCDEGPWHVNAIDIMGAFCMLSNYADIFKVYGTINGKEEKLDNTTYQFPCKDAGYDYVKGEIPGYGPEKMLEYSENVKETAAFSNYHGSTKGGETNRLGHSMTRVRFFVDPSQKADAEKLLGHSIPDEFCKTNYDGEVVQIGGGMSMAGMVNVDNSSLAGMIINAGLRVGQYCVSRGVKYGDARTLVKADPNKDKGMKIVARDLTTDCSGGVWWILAEAGLLKKPTEWPPATPFYRTNFQNKFVEGVGLVEVDISQLQPGDIILWDRNKSENNHVAIYAAPGKCFDFGSQKRVSSMQPGNKGLNDSSAIAGRKIWRVVPTGSRSNIIRLIKSNSYSSNELNFIRCFFVSISFNKCFTSTAYSCCRLFWF